MPERWDVAVIGCGHVGAVVAAGLAARHAVLGFDVSEQHVNDLQAAKCAFFEASLQESLDAGLQSGRLSFTTDERSLDFADVLVVCVDTPAGAEGVHLGNLHSALNTVASSLHRTGANPTVLVRSTTPPGQARVLRSRLFEIAGREIPFAVVPEFLRQGSAVADFQMPERLVVGSDSTTAMKIARKLFASTDVPVIETSLESAELIKHGSNAFLATRVSFINELAAIAAAHDCDIDAVVQGMGLDSRIGTRFLQPGIGYGGSCLPRDVTSLISCAAAAGLPSPLLRAVDEVNRSQLSRVVEEVTSRLGSLEGRIMAVWGLTYKGGTEDLRSSPALAIVERLIDRGARIRAYEPSWSAGRPPVPGVEFADSPLGACTGADALLILSDWSMFKDVDLAGVQRQMRGNFVFDGRNVLDVDSATAAGLDYAGVGKSGAERRGR